MSATKKAVSITRLTAKGAYKLAVVLPDSDGRPLTFSRLLDLLSSAVVRVEMDGGTLEVPVRELMKVESGSSGERIVCGNAIRGDQCASVAIESD